MPELKKAELVGLQDYSSNPQQPASGDYRVEVQFNPETLKISLSNQNSGGEQPGGSPTQFIGTGSSTMSVELLFDTTASGIDVRKRTEAVAYFIFGNSEQSSEERRVPPIVSFRWGTFIFEGVMDAMDETLDYFAEDGTPLRATVSFSLKRPALVLYQEDRLTERTNEPDQGLWADGPLQAAQSGQSLQAMAGSRGKSSDWKKIAAANDIDDPLRLQVGALIDLRVKR
jgi:hypothetical protein